ncbi:hypothetical protein F2Q69_00039068 [Brassica cretica]|uniref:Uncharacterized protein n=1 Tax=Brassica cretica TaxID=69181 RepID=A0A8S9SR19_BRACR|nr:hypothetical protein F2Q69_00039068 [Brassica cretica]
MYTMADVAAIWESTGAFSGIVSMETVLNFAGVVEIEFAGAVELGSYILYPVNNVCSGFLVS